MALNEWEQARAAWDGTDYNKKVYEGVPGYQSTNPEISYGMDKAAFNAAHPDYWGGGAPSALPPAPGGDDPIAKLMRGLQRRTSVMNLVPTADKTRADRALAALYQNVPGAREQLASNEALDPGDWRGAVRQWAASQNIADPSQYAAEQGFMPKPPARTISDLVDERTLQIIKGQWLNSPDLEKRVNDQLEAAYQADLAGNPPPAQAAPEGSAAFLPPIPSTQFWQQVLALPERQGAAQLFQAMGMTPEQLADQIRRLAPPGGAGGDQAQLVYRGR